MERIKVSGIIVQHAYMGLCLSYIHRDKFGVYTEYVNVVNGSEFKGKHVLATIEGGRATVTGLDPEADENGEQHA